MSFITLRFQDTVGSNAVLEAQLLPELGTDLVAALANLEGDYLAGHCCVGKNESAVCRCEQCEMCCGSARDTVDLFEQKMRW